MIKDYFKTTCPCCGQLLELFMSENGSIGIRYYDTEDQAEILEVLKANNIELGNVKDFKEKI